MTELIMAKYVVNGKVMIDDLRQVEDDIMGAHEPPATFFRFLCGPCHRKQDRVKSEA